MTNDPAQTPAATDHISQKAVLESALAEQRMRWRSGARCLVETYLDRNPDFAQEDALLDLLYNELLLRRELGEEPRLGEFSQRFPQVAEQLRLLFEVDDGLETDSQYLSTELTAINSPQSNLAGIESRSHPSPDPAEPPSSSEVKIAQRLVASNSFRGTVELRTLLQRRLRFMGIVDTLVYLQSGWQLRTFWHIDQWRHYRLHMGIVWGVLAISACCAAFLLLWRRQLSMTWLRAIEVVLVTGPLVQLTAVLVDMTWLQGDLLRFLQLPGHDAGYLFNSIALFYFPIITCYGILIPNTGRRCLAVSLAIGLVPLFVLLGGLPLSPEVWTSYRRAFLEGFFWVTMWISVAVACAAYGCHRINVLQREAFVARRLGQYRLRERLGSGGMGEVYLAEHVLLKQPCAVKIIRPERAGDPAALRRFEREVQATAKLKHWNTVTIFDYGIAADGTFYYVMEYLPGYNLEEMVERCGPLPAARVCHFLHQACAALAEAHAIGLVHRDIKPANIIVCERGGMHDVVKVLDFGLVREIDANRDGQSLTVDGVVAGTPAYMSPEQASGSTNLDARSDIYSLGAVAYFLLSGRPPFADRTQVQVLAAHLYEAPRPLVEIRPEVSADLAEIVLQCLAKSPADRFADIKRFDAAISEVEASGRWTEADAAAWWRQSGIGPAAARVVAAM